MIAIFGFATACSGGLEPKFGATHRCGPQLGYPVSMQRRARPALMLFLRFFVGAGADFRSFEPTMPLEGNDCQDCLASASS